MKSNSVLAHLALRFASHPENLATEALAFILKGSDAACTVFIELLRSRGVSLPRTLTFETQQVGTDSAIPDMNCSDDAGIIRAIVENKLWAGLTDNQPNTCCVSCVNLCCVYEVSSAMRKKRGPGMRG